MGQDDKRVRRPQQPAAGRRRVKAPEGSAEAPGGAAEAAEASARDLLSGVEPLVAVEGDVLHVCYPEVKLPLAEKFSGVAIGGHRYTRQMGGGEDVVEEARSIAAMLRAFSIEQGAQVIREWSEEMAGAKRR